MTTKHRSVMKFSMIAAFAGAAAVGFTAAVEAQDYTMTIIPNSSGAYGINDSNTVVGIETNGSTPFSYNSGTTAAIGGASLLSPSFVNAINSGGTIVGGSWSGVSQQAAVFGTNSVTFLGAAGSISQANAINTTGEVAGNVQDTSGLNHAAFFSSSTPNQSATIIDNVNSFGMGINDSGTIVGYQANSSSRFDAFSYSGGTLTDLGSFGVTGALGGYARSINNSGTIAGYYVDSAGYSRAVDYSGGVATTLDSSGAYLNSRANAINGTGIVVGTADNGGTTPVAFVYSSGVFTNLNNLVTNLPVGDQLISANAINGNGDIVGFGGYTASGDVTYGFLLTPVTAGAAVPSPGSLGLLFGGAAGLGLILLAGRIQKRT